MASEYVVKRPAGKYCLDFEKCCEEYLTRRWPDWKTKDRTYMFPPVFRFRYTSPTGDAAGAVELNEAERGYMRGDYAESKIFRLLETFGREKYQPMFVFSQFKYKEFIEETKEAMRDMHPLFASLEDRFVGEKVKGEIDFVVLHRRIGVILIEVKANEEFKSSRDEEAKKQLKVAEDFVRVFLEAKGINIPVYKVVAMPSVPDEGNSSDGYINLRKIHLVMDDKGNVQDLLPFEQWWGQNFTQGAFEEHEEKFLSLISVFVGQRVTVSATAQILGRVFQTIDEQSFLRQSYRRIKKKRGRESTEVGRPEKEDASILARQFMFLNEEQLEVWKGEEKQLICGPAGTGKTILIQHKALECAKRNEKVVIFVPAILGKLYEKFFSSNKILSLYFNYERDRQHFEHSSMEDCALKFFKKFFGRSEPCDEKVLIVTICQLPLFSNFVASEEERVDEIHIFVDEFQSFPASDSLKRFLIGHQSPSFYRWIAYDVQQILSTDTIENYIAIQDLIFYLCNTESFYHAPSLQTVMRCTSEIFETLKKFNEESFRGERTQKYDEFVKKYWYLPQRLGHHVCGPEVIPHIEKKVSLDVNPGFYFKIIEEEINQWAKVDDKYELNKVAVLVPDKKWIAELSAHLQEKGVSHCRIGDDKGVIVLDLMEHAQSYEWPVVIAICDKDFEGINYFPFSRAVTRLVTVEPDMPSKEVLTNYLLNVARTGHV